MQEIIIQGNKNVYHENDHVNDDADHHCQETLKKDKGKINDMLYQLEDEEMLKREEEAQDLMWKEIKRKMLNTNLSDKRAVGGLLGTAILGIIGLAVGLNVIGIVIGGVLGAILGTYAGRKIKQNTLKQKKLTNVNIQIVKFAAFAQQFLDFDQDTVSAAQITQEMVNKEIYFQELFQKINFKNFIFWINQLPHYDWLQWHILCIIGQLRRLLRLMLTESRLLIMMSHKLQKYERRQVVKLQRKILKCFRQKKYFFALQEIYWVVKCWTIKQKAAVEEDGEEAQRCRRVEKQIARISYQFLRPIAKLLLFNRRVLDDQQKRLEEKIHSLLMSIPLIELNERYPEFMQRQEALAEEFMESIYKEVDLKQLKAILEDEVAQEILNQDQLQQENKSKSHIEMNQGQLPDIVINGQSEQDRKQQKNLMNLNSLNCTNNHGDASKCVIWASPPPSHSMQLSKSVAGKQRLIDLIHLASKKQIKEEQEKQNATSMNTHNNSVPFAVDGHCSIGQFPSRIIEQPFQEDPFHFVPKTLLSGGKRETPFQQQIQEQQSQECNDLNNTYLTKHNKDNNRILSTRSEPVTQISSARTIQFGQQCQQQRRDQYLDKGNMSSNMNILDGYIHPKRITDHTDEDDAMLSCGSLGYGSNNNNYSNFHAHHQRVAKVFDLPNTKLSEETEQDVKITQKGNKDRSSKLAGKLAVQQGACPVDKQQQIVNVVYSKQCKDASLNFKNCMKKNTVENMYQPRNNEDQVSFKRGKRKDIFVKMNSCGRLGEYGKKSARQKKTTSRKNCTNQDDPAGQLFHQNNYTHPVKDDLCMGVAVSLSVAARKYLKEEDFTFEDKFIELKELTDQDVDDDWKYILTKQDLSICQKQDVVNPKLMVRAETFLENYDLNHVFEEIYNIAKRSKWDKFQLGYQVIESHENEKDVVYFYSSPGFGIENRDFVLKRIVKRDYPEEGQITILYYSTTHPSFPEKSGSIRVNSHIAAYIIKQSPEDPQSSLMSIISSSDLKGKIPAYILNFVSWKFLPEWVESLKKALKESTSGSQQ